MSLPFVIRRAEGRDAAEIAAIYNAAIDERMATFNTSHGTEDEFRDRVLRGGQKHPILVAVGDGGEGQTLGWGSISSYSVRAAYSGIGEVSIYVDKENRGKGIGRSLLGQLIDVAAKQGYWKLMGRVFDFNQVSRNLFESMGFEEVGIHQKHGKLDGVWIDVVEVERLIPENIG